MQMSILYNSVLKIASFYDYKFDRTLSEHYYLQWLQKNWN